MSSSVQLTVDSARTTATRLGSQYSSPDRVNTTDGTTAGTISGTITSGIYAPGAISATQKTAGGILFQHFLPSR